MTYAMSQPITEVYYNLLLLTNLGNEETGGTLTVDSYTFDPQLSKGDVVQIEEWKIPVGGQNQTLSFEARVMEIKKVVVRHHCLKVNIILESPNRETIPQLEEALENKNPD
ncbi:hypothetical protein Cri9333_4374 [Crinalium epipsammum PCC 9333]|uniref:Uncharacterized protein n=1 Tax=Crinalium epipsammum PCC 9333 TaxID=1173022 RepID=K9W5T6_9CYAN|nr:hypothetical protein [Crinalium epipsammum]AFZ15159.1 hypothetical protein Cri9333_4374 [Crinalium epipsammum PCC 9333]